MAALNKAGALQCQANLAELRHVLLSLKGQAEREMVEAEARVNAFSKLLSFSDMAAEQFRDMLAAIEAAEGPANG
jgi:hypothetical protein